MVKWTWVITGLTTTTLTWFMEITSPLSRGLQLIIGEFSRDYQRPRVISAKEHKRTMSPPPLFVWCLFKNSNAYGLGWREVLKNTRSSMSLNAPLSKTTWLGFEPERGTSLRLPQVVALFVLLSVDISRTRVGKHFLEGGWELFW